MFTRNTSKKKATNASPTAMLVTTTLTIDTEETTATLPPIKQATSPSKSFIEKLTNHEPISPSHESERGNLNILPRSGSTDEEHPVRSSDERSMVAKTLSIMHLMKDSKAPKTNDLISSTEEYQRDLNGALKFRLEDMKDEKENNTALSYYDLGLNYMKIAHTNDILKQEDDATRNRQSALEAFDQAISLASDNPNELALYSANKAKCLYNMYDANDENDERLHEAKTLAEKYSNAGVANETLGYIYTCYGNYEKALSYFERSLQDHEYKAAHKILSLYDQTVVLAALGRKEEALARFKRAEGKKLPIEIDTEDKILITEIRTEKYKDYIFKLAKSAHSGGRLRSISDSSTPDDESIAVLLDQQEKELRSVTVALLPGTKSQLNKADEGLTTIKQQTSAIHKKIAIDSRPYLNDQTKLQRAINKHTAFNDNDLEEIQKAIKNDSRLSNFSNEIQMFLNATYAGSQAVLSKEVAGQASNQYGLGSWIASKAGDHAPLPIQLGLNLISYGLAVKDDELKVERATNFVRATAVSQKSMEALSEKIALQLTIMHKKHLDETSNQPSDIIEHQHKKVTFFQSKAKTTDEESITKGQKIAQFILSLIFDGRLKDIEYDKKVEIILGYIALNDEYYSDLPKHSTTISELTLTHIKTLHTEQKILWKTKEEAEGQFTRAVATSIANINSRNNIDPTEMSTELAKNVSTDKQVIFVGRRVSKPWEKKAYIDPQHFMSNLDFFSPHVAKTAQQIKPQPDSARASLTSIEMNDINQNTSSTSSDEESALTLQHIVFEEERGMIGNSTDTI